MKLHLGDDIVDKTSFWMDGDAIHLIDQRALPSRIVVMTSATIEEAASAISTLAVRGAPAIGAFGACSLALALSKGADPIASYDTLLETRPTAVDLRNGLDRVRRAWMGGGAEAALDTAKRLCKEIIESCRRIGEAGGGLIPDNGRILTHCNAGALATLDWGTALAPIRVRAREGGSPFVWVSETRPLLQGARLTSWELGQEGIEHKVVVDAASGYLMRCGLVDLVIVGADRVCVNGDFANKIGTYSKAVLARENDVPFYVAFPWTTVDALCHSGEEIPIEIRSDMEVLELDGVKLAPPSSRGFNPAFDIVPSDYVTGYITEKGVLPPDEFRERIPGSIS